jgi:hypothetical protein
MSTTIGSVVLDGVITADGNLEVQVPSSFPPGPVRVTVQPVQAGERLPDPPWPDEGIPAPFDLPYLGVSKRVEPRPAKERLPEPFDLGDEEDK